jgi:VanZ family protein
MHKTSAWPLSGAYVGLVVYASLYPSRAGATRRSRHGTFLFAGWPRYWTGFDLMANVLGYVPLGFLLALSFMRRGNVRYFASHPNLAAILVAGLAGTALSLCMEALQNYLPSRVASNVDFALNAAARSSAPWSPPAWNWAARSTAGAAFASAGSSRRRAARWCCWPSGRSPCCSRRQFRWAWAR